jgi:hypothetical protein
MGRCIAGIGWMIVQAVGVVIDDAAAQLARLGEGSDAGTSS